MQVEAGRGRQPSCSPLATTSLYLKLFIFKDLGLCTEADAVIVPVTTSWPGTRGLYLFHEVWTLPFLPTPFLLLIKPSFISEQSIFPEQKAQMLHLDKAETKPLFCQKYPFHFSFCPASHQIKSTLTNIVTHPRSTFFGKQSVRYKKHHPAPSVCHKHTGRGAGASPSPCLTVSTALPVHPGTDSPNELSQPLSHHCYWWLCACFSCALVGSNLPSPQELLLQPGAAHGEPNAQPNPSGSTFPPGCAQAESTGRGFGPMELLAGDCPCHWPCTSKAAAQETLAATYLAAQCNLIINLEALQQSIKSQPIAVV